MILRRLKAHVEKENWFAVFIDFCIVVIGVFIGIQVANWNEARADQARGENIKARLAAEFIEIESEYARHVRDVASWITNAEKLGNDILTGAIDLTSLELSDRISGIQWRPPGGGSNTVAELINQGDMDLLGSPDLVEMLLQFQTLTERHVRSNENLLKQNSGSSYSAFNAAILSAIPQELRTEEFDVYLDEIASKPGLYIATKDASRRLQGDLGWHQSSLESACQILTELDEPCRASEALAAETSP